MTLRALSTREQIGVAFLCLLVGFASGKWTTIPETRVETKTVDHVVVRDQIKTIKTDDTKTNTDNTKQKVQVKTVYVDRLVSGEVKTQTVTQTQYVDRVQTQIVEKKGETQTETKYVDRVVTQDKIVTPALTKWSVGAGIGVQPSHLSPVAEVDASYRLLGPFSVSVWGAVPTTSPLDSVIGIGVRIQF